MRHLIILTLVVLSAVLFTHFEKYLPDRNDSTHLQSRKPRTTSLHAYDPLSPPLFPIQPSNLGVRKPRVVIDHPTRIREIIAAGKCNELQSATCAWFRDDPLAVREWLAGQQDLTPFSPAISAIALHLSESSDLENSLAWAESIPDEAIRNGTYHGILSLALRQDKVDIEQLDLTGLPEEIIADLRSGAPGD